ncbi:MAG: hypothetical protein WA435_10635 [Gallionellaceae bacterium]
MWSSTVVVHPWVGNNYKNPIYFKYKTLILGESNFTDSPENFNSSLVIRCVEDDLAIGGQERDTNGFCRFSTKIRRVIFGRNESLGPNGLWQDVAFYNFVQSLVGNKARIRPTYDMWKESVPAFFEIVEKLQPSRVLVLGKTNWSNLLQHIQHHPEGQHVATLTIGTNLITAGYINHPLSSLAYTTWQPIARQLLLT